MTVSTFLGKSQTLAELFSKSYQQYGGKVILKESYANNAVDFANLLKKVKTSFLAPVKQKEDG